MANGGVSPSHTLPPPQPIGQQLFSQACAFERSNDRSGQHTLLWDCKGCLLSSPRGHEARKKQILAELQDTGLEGWFFNLGVKGKAQATQD